MCHGPARAVDGHVVWPACLCTQPTLSLHAAAPSPTLLTPTASSRVYMWHAQNLRRTVEDLVNAGLSVAVCEEVCTAPAVMCCAVLSDAARLSAHCALCWLALPPSSPHASRAIVQAPKG